MYGALEVFNSHAPTFFSCCGKCLKKQMSQLPFARFDTFESGRHEELLAQYPQVVDILLFVVEHFRSKIYIITYCFYTIKCCQLLLYISAPGGLDQDGKEMAGFEDWVLNTNKTSPAPLIFLKTVFRSSGEGESYIQETAIYLLNALVCQVSTLGQVQTFTRFFT